MSTALAHCVLGHVAMFTHAISLDRAAQQLLRAGARPPPSALSPATRDRFTALGVDVAACLAHRSHGHRRAYFEIVRALAGARSTLCLATLDGAGEPQDTAAGIAFAALRADVVAHTVDAGLSARDAAARRARDALVRAAATPLPRLELHVARALAASKTALPPRVPDVQSPAAFPLFRAAYACERPDRGVGALTLLLVAVELGWLEPSQSDENPSWPIVADELIDAAAFVGAREAMMSAGDLRSSFTAGLDFTALRVANERETLRILAFPDVQRALEATAAILATLGETPGRSDPAHSRDRLRRSWTRVAVDPAGDASRYALALGDALDAAGVCAWEAS